MPNLVVEVKKKSWGYLISKLKYLYRECRKKDKIIKAYEEQIRILKANFNQTTKDI